MNDSLKLCYNFEYNNQIVMEVADAINKKKEIRGYNLPY